jgi:glyoxylase-like metal-dependent hydrolase (beta-lactamase superfamily II)
MRIRKPGKVRDRLWFLGRKESCVYLLEGDEESILINGGMSYLIPDLLQQFEAFEIDETRITKVLILHAHFDHVGIAPFFKRRNPEIEICASKRGWKILQMPQAIATINQFSRDVARKMGNEHAYDSFELDWDEGTTGTVLAEGDRIDLGGVELMIYETPGHSSCAITAYSPQLKALFASDAGGIPFKRMILTSGNSHYTNYQLSLEKLKAFDVEYICADHYGYVTGTEAKDFMKVSIYQAQKHRTLMEEAFLRTKDTKMAAKELVSEFYRENPDYLITAEIFEGVYHQMVRHVAEALESASG